MLLQEDCTLLQETYLRSGKVLNSKISETMEETEEKDLESSFNPYQQEHGINESCTKLHRSVSSEN